ncbi:hypothetical protein RirG_165260 [Rhizophagus irregularis DAOM 197198w]|uniref:Uncharacterized protein n=1 Tax=Rhizophagus irregularis (strain DAOM 197198w) TaxID=1432141 RepID=A0A015KQJ9_RHIIW|nr:hypothetical protein RirG_165260 [Rhizophagus irregularis DAOM 197198w]
MTLRYWQDWYGIWPKKWIFLEPGEAKTTIDSHHAQIAHSINRYVKLGFDISSGKDIENAISGICGTTWKKEKPITWHFKFEWSWPITGEYAGYIQARDIANLGAWTNFSPKKLEKLQSKTIKKPDPNVSTSSIPKNPWTVPLPNDTDETTDSTCKYRNSVLDNTNLSSHDPYSDERKNSAKDRNKVILDPSSQFLFWPLACGWALKSAQKYGKKGSGKRISKKVWNLLQEYFLEGNVNKSERHTAESMLAQLKKNVEDGVIEEEEVPKLETIRNWISRYTSQHRQESAIVAQASKI